MDWEFFVVEDGRDKGYNYFIMRAVHPSRGSVWRMWGWIPSDGETERFKRNIMEER